MIVNMLQKMQRRFVKSMTAIGLIAEHREIKRIPNLVNRGRYSLDNQPDTFKLGKGHVKFFYDKLLYLKRRYDSLFDECRKRGFNVQNYSNAWRGAPKHLMNDYSIYYLAIDESYF